MPLYHPQDETILAILAEYGATIETDEVKQCYTVKSKDGLHSKDIDFGSSNDTIRAAAETVTSAQGAAAAPKAE